MKSESLSWQIANALLNAELIKDDVSTTLLESTIGKCLPIIEARSKKKVHWLDPRDGGPVCNDAGKSPVITPDKSRVTCRRCRGTYLFDGQPARY